MYVEFFDSLPRRGSLMNELELTGRATTHVIDLADLKCSLHYEAIASFLAMRDAAAVEGIDLRARSSFRDFDTQLLIWNQKWNGERPLYDRRGTLLDRKRLSDGETLDAILSWSAVPGGRRHHWGSDLDVIDAAAIPAGTKIE